MTTLFDQAIYAVAKLPPEEQDAIAREILERITVNDRREIEFANSLHDDWLTRQSSDPSPPVPRPITFRHEAHATKTQ